MENKWVVTSFCRRVVVLAQTLSVATLIVGSTGSVLAVMAEEPKSFSLKDNSQEHVDRKVLSKIDVERLLAEDRAQGTRPGPQRFAVAANVAFTVNNSGTWQILANGRLWRLRIQSPGARSLNLDITHYDMPASAKLWIYDPAHRHVEGPYTERNRSNVGSFWTPVIEGDEIIVEVFVPGGAPDPVLEIGKVNQGYRGL
jgi:hypothetical protein